MKPDELYEAFLESKEEYYKVHHMENVKEVPLCIFYYKIKEKFPRYKVEAFHKLQEEMYFNWTNWNGYVINLMKGRLSGVCTQYKHDRITIHPEIGWKFIVMKKI